MSTEVNLSTSPVFELAAAMDRGSLSSASLVQGCLERISKFDPFLGAFSDVLIDRAVRQASQLDEERRQGRVRGPLHGIPVVLKDLVDIAGVRTTAGSRLFDGYVADGTATVVSRLESAGIVTLGKTQMVELAFGGWGTNRVMGTPVNPWDGAQHRVPGGSSSGAGVAVAAGFAPLAVGTDTGGSVRIPASLCGLVGMKTTAKKIPTDHLVLLSETLDTVGPIARCVTDTALVFDALSGETSAQSLGGRLDRRDAACRIGILGSQDLQGVDPEVLSAYRSAIDELESLGAEISRFSLPGAAASCESFENVVDMHGVIIAYEGWRRHGDRINAAPDKMNPAVLERFRAGESITAGEYHVAILKRNEARIKMAAQFESFDAVMTPTTPIAAIRREDVDESILPLSRYTRAVNYFGLCALAVPSGLNSEGLPLSVQFIGGPDTEERLLNIGFGYENARGSFPAPVLSGFETC